MIVAAHQPHYLPWLGYLDKLAKADLFVVMDDLQYEAQNFQNRQRLKLQSGAQWLTVPLERGSQSDLIRDKQIDNTGSPKQHWQRRSWLTIEHSYRRARYFARYADAIRDIYERPWLSLLALDLHVLGLARDWFAISTPVVLASSLGLAGQKTERILDLCRRVGARAYLTGGGGSTDYLDDERLGRAGFGVIWQCFEHPAYRQVGDGFASHLGFLDLLFNCGPASRDILFSRSHPMRLEAA